MTISWVGTVDTTANSDTASPFASQTIAMPTHVADDLLLVASSVKPYTTVNTTATAGWVRTGNVASGTNASGVSTGSVRCTTYTKTAASAAEPALVLDYPAAYNPGNPQPVSFRKTVAGDWGIEVATGADGNISSTAISVTAGATQAFTTGDHIVAVVANPSNTAITSPVVSVPGCTLGTIAERVVDPQTSSGDDSAIYIYEGPITGGTATGPATFTATAAAANQSEAAVVFYRLSEKAPVSATLAVHATPGMAVGGTVIGVHSSVLPVGATSALAISGQLTTSAVLATRGTPTLTVGALATQLATVPVTALSTLAISGVRSQFAVLPMSATALLEPRSGDSLVIRATPTLTIAGRKELNAVIAAVSASALAVGGVRTQPAVLVSQAISAAAFGVLHERRSVLTLASVPSLFLSTGASAVWATRATPVMTLAALRTQFAVLSMSATSGMVAFVVIIPQWRTHHYGLAVLLSTGYDAVLLDHGLRNASLLSGPAIADLLSTGALAIIET